MLAREDLDSTIVNRIFILWYACANMKLIRINFPDKHELLCFFILKMDSCFDTLTVARYQFLNLLTFWVPRNIYQVSIIIMFCEKSSYKIQS